MTTGSQNISSAEFVQQLKKEIQAFPKIRIKHPFLKRCVQEPHHGSDPRLGDPRLSVPRGGAADLMLRYLACNDPEIAQKLWGVVEEETRGMDTGSAGHNELAIRFAESIGLTKQQLETPCCGLPPRLTSTTSN